ncbi:hypothetical protein PV325_011492 [Microctonus aethiopoides]|nr:hypothetical protein PV325_011492 [Microctonus aethiopoides]
MVLGRNDKRKRKEGDLVDLMDPLSESPKRAKVHAQRKFAQGAATVFTSPQTLVKEKEKSKPSLVTELITHKRPNTEDFLTFLCFRGTSILPPSLNFFNVGQKKDKSESKSSKKSNNNSQLISNTTATAIGVLKVESHHNSVSLSNKSTDVDKKKVTNDIKKSVNKYKTTTSTIQALKKKYQEQRLAKQRIGNKFKTQCVMRTRSATCRTILKSTTKITPRKFIRQIEPKRHCLRSNTLIEKSRKAIPQKSKIIAKSKKKSVVKEQSSESSSTESLSEDDHKPKVKSQQQPKRSLKTNQKNTCPTNKLELRRVTRSHSEVASSNQKISSQRPSRKTKEAATVYMEILSRKLVSPDLEVDESLSTDSYPELPNARKTLQTENEMKIKSKSITKTNKVKETKRDTSVGRKSGDKLKTEKNSLKTKKQIKPQKYIDSEDESVSSEESNITRPITRRTSAHSIAPIVNPPTSRSLRSSARNPPQKSETTPKLSPRDNSKTLIKRKREQITNKSSSGGEKKCAKEKKLKNKEETQESEDESLGSVLNKIKKKRELAEAAEEKILQEKKSLKHVEVTVKVDSSKISDDEGSFRGFTTKAITKVLNSCSNQVSVNLVMPEKNKAKTTIIEKQEIIPLEITSPAENVQSKVEAPGPLIPPAEIVKSEKKESLSSSNVQVGSLSSIPSLSESEQKCIHVAASSPTPIIDMPPSATLGRKERVNMSTEQIEKWLNESSMAKDENNVEMETVSTFSFEVSEKNKPDVSHLSIPTRIQHLVRPVNVAIAKMAEKMNPKNRRGDQMNSSAMVTGTGIALAKVPITTNLIPTNRNKINADIKEIIKGRIAKAICVANKETNVCDDNSDVSSRADGTTSTEGSPDKKSMEKKSIYQQRKTFLPKVKERKIAKPSVNAFSPENESSVYAFESDPEAPVNTPFRRKQRDSKSGASGSSDIEISHAESEDGNVKSPCKSTEKDEKELSKSKNVGTSNDDVDIVGAIQSINSSADIINQLNKFQMPENFRNLSNIQILPFGKIPNVWNNVNCSASIAVQVNFDDQSQDQHANSLNVDGGQQKSTEISTQTESTNENDDDSDAHVFYIPLQTVARNGPNMVQGQPLIQGVAVKLGTEGPNGPNQRVLLRAQLVTKPPLAVARCPPVGTVQPTTRTPPSGTSDPIPSTSASAIVSQPSNKPTSLASPQPLIIQKAEKIIDNNKQQQTTSTSVHVNTEKVQKSPKVSRERKSSIDTTKATKKNQTKVKKGSEVMSTITPTFPSMEVKGEARLVEAPTFHPSEKDFQDPLEYIDKIRPIAEKYGICRVVPPSNFKPECKVSDDMRFTAYNQYIHRMLHRWGPNVKEMMAIKKYLATQSITLNQPPWVGGMEVDLPHLYQTVQSLGGLKEVIEKKKWQKVADGMKIPKSAQDRVTKLDDIYCKYLLPYDTLSTMEREKLFDEVEMEWGKRESKALHRLNESLSTDNEDDEDEDSSDEIEECIVKGRNMPLNAFYRIARNTQRMWFGESQGGACEADGASAIEVENAFWKHVAERKRHVCVHAASIDSSGRGFGFSVAKNSPFARHPWNLKVLTNNAGSVLRALGPLMGVTVPTLHVGMLFSACCWYRDPHGLPWIEYLHTGAKKIWYGIPDEHSDTFRDALSKMVPRFCKNQTIWLPSDTAMVPPEMLVNNGVPLCHTVQEPGQFIIVFPKAFTSSICTGYVVSESVYFAQTTWLEHAEQIFKDLRDSCEPSMFSLERLLFSIINDSRSHIDILKQILPAVTKIRENELNYRHELEYYGLTKTEKLSLPGSGKRKKGQKVKEDESDYECETCRANLFVSLVTNSQDDSAYCLPHALQLIGRKKQVLKHCTLKYTYSEEELDDLIHKLEDRIEAKSKKTNQNRQIK